MAILESVTPLVEQLSIDEAFLDVRRRPPPARRPGRDRGHDPRAGCATRPGSSSSVGVASTKFLAKLASDLAKPDGLLVVEPGTEREFLAPLPVSRLWGVGPATLTKLERMGLRTIGDVAALDESVARRRARRESLGRAPARARAQRRPRAVVPERDAKSIGAEETFGADLHTLRRVRTRARAARRPRRAHGCGSAGLAARTVTLKIRFGDFETRTRARTLPERDRREHGRARRPPASCSPEFDVGRGRPAARRLARRSSTARPRCRARSTSTATAQSDRRERTERRAAVERAVDEVRDRFGSRAVGPATLVERRRRRMTGDAR